MNDAEKFLQQYAEAEEEGDFSRLEHYTDDGSDYFDVDNLTADVIINLRWSADYGMPSGDGWWSLVRFPDDSAITIRGGDDIDHPAVEAFPRDDDGRARFLAHWCDIYAPLAALTLEPLDPDRTLSDSARAAWERTITTAPSYITVHVDEPLLGLTRDAFATDPVYARAKAALALPATEEGGLLLRAVESLQVGPTEYCTGQWEDLDA